MKTALIVTALIAAPALFTRPVAAADLTVTITQLATNVDLPASAFTDHVSRETDVVSLDDVRRQPTQRQR